MYHVFKYMYMLFALNYVPFSCLGMRMHVYMLLNAKKIFVVGGTRFKAKHLTYYSLHDNRKITEKLFTQQGKS